MLVRNSLRVHCLLARHFPVYLFYSNYYSFFLRKMQLVPSHDVLKLARIIMAVHHFAPTDYFSHETFIKSPQLNHSDDYGLGT